MSEYNDIGRPASKHENSGEKPKAEHQIQPGSWVRVYTGVRNDPNEHTRYLFEGLVQTDKGEKAKLSFKTASGKRFVRIADFDDLIPA